MKTQAELFDDMTACILNLYKRGVVMECDGDAFDELEEVARNVEAYLQETH